MHQTVNKNSTLKKEAVHYFNRSVSFYRTIPRHIPKDGTHHYLVHNRCPTTMCLVLSTFYSFHSCFNIIFASLRRSDKGIIFSWDFSTRFNLYRRWLKHVTSLFALPEILPLILTCPRSCCPRTFKCTIHTHRTFYAVYPTKLRKRS